MQVPLSIFVNLFLGFIFTTIVYGILGVGVLYIANKKAEQIDSNPVKELGSFVCEDFNEAFNTFNGEYVINDGYLYGFNPNMKYSNEQNCKKISDLEITKVIGEYYVSEDGKVYTYNSSTDELNEYTGSIPSYLLGENIVKAIGYGSSYDYKYYVLKTDGKIYKVGFKKVLANIATGSITYELSRDDEYLSYEDETIKSFNVSDGKINLVITDKAIYTNKITNSFYIYL